MSQLQIPSPSRPVSAQVQSHSYSQNSGSGGGGSGSGGRRQPPPHRASHQVVSSSSASPSHPSSNNPNNANSNGDDGNNNNNNPGAYTDVYAHPAAMAFAAAHPRRTIPKFGPYLLLQTLGEGEFGKVKLGLHSQWGEEVAVKLIRRGNVDTAVRMSKVEREIEVLRTLKHPNIVRLYDVIETDKYIGIIIEYASGGELFDHILAHRYLRERDASRLFSQLISGVWYIHQKKIVHRDLKLENLLLDRHRNVIITDFGFANRFEHRADDLMQTSCGSPCYAAPELVISEGLYVGSAVDIWSCGVILYAMLAGYLPFDDDPANPDGDNINLLYKYIVNTPLAFPEYISDEARDLLKMMLVPDPRRRAGLKEVMRHPWLAAYHLPRDDDETAEGEPQSENAFGRTVEELERAAMEQHQQKRLAYQRQMRATSTSSATAPTLPAAAPSPVARAQTTGPTQSAGQAQNQSQRSKQPEFLYDSASGAAAGGYGGVGVGADDDDPFGPPPGTTRRAVAPVAVEEGKGKGREREEGGKDKDKFRHTVQIEYDGGRGGRREKEKEKAPPSPAAPSNVSASPAQPGHRTTGSMDASPRGGAGGSPVRERRERERSRTPTRAGASPAGVVTPTKNNTTPTANGAEDSQQGTPGSVASITERRERRRRGSASSVGVPASFNANAPGSPVSAREPGSPKPLPAPPSPASANATSPPTTWKNLDGRGVMGPGEVVSVNGAERPAVMDVFGEKDGRDAEKKEKDGAEEKEKDTEKEKDAEKEKDGKKDGKKSRRNTLTLVVNPINSIRAGISGRRREPSSSIATTNGSSLAVPAIPAAPRTGGADKSFDVGAGPAGRASGMGGGADMRASTSKARKVMQWIRGGRDSLGVAPTFGRNTNTSADSSSTLNNGAANGEGGADDANSPVQVFVTTPGSAGFGAGAAASLSPIVTKTLAGGKTREATATDAVSPVSAGVSPTATTASVTPSFASRFRRSINVGGGSSMPKASARDRESSAAAAAAQAQTQVAAGAGGSLRIHHGAVDQGTITTGQPPEVMRHVREVLGGMGVEIYVESDYKFRCIRAKQKRGGAGAGSTGPGGVAAFTMSGSAGSNGVDKRGLPLPSQSSFSGGGMLRGLLMRRQSSQVSAAGPNASFEAADDSLNNSGILTAEPIGQADTVYGAATEDAGDEVRFSVELTRLDRLNDTYSLDIRRLKGNLRSYKFLYDMLRTRADLQR
ncbi:CAMK/CAMKL/Kin4 protein kinase [Mycena metata]|uniref:CAMK/CAMKL/Kin4 protein kinase n=1 Tax=Mycena metata TaxID=1033252 RepID=A0AAD7N3Y7_9AGAR|nr:CAMK/CAMKL/Kin4 protein kinase [Mycena metata]